MNDCAETARFNASCLENALSKLRAQTKLAGNGCQNLNQILAEQYSKKYTCLPSKLMRMQTMHGFVAIYA